MKVRNIALDENEDPELVTVEMTLDEAAFIARVAGSLSPHAVLTALKDDIRWYKACAETYECLTGSVFNRYWDGGLGEVIPPWNRGDDE